MSFVLRSKMHSYDILHRYDYYSVEACTVMGTTVVPR